MKCIPVTIDEGGYIYSTYPQWMVHKETRGMDNWPMCCSRAEARREARPDRVCGVLELTDEGGGKRIWVEQESEARWSALLEYWACCYGEWPVKTFSAGRE